MKLVRPLLVTLAIVAVICGLVAGLALTPAIQRRAVLWAVAGRPGLELKIGEFSAGLSRLRLHGVALQRNGLAVSLDRLEAEYSLAELLFRRRLHLRRLNAEGLVVNGSRLSPAKAQAAAAGAPAVAPGLLARLQLPIGIVLDDTRLAGRALLPVATGRAPVAAEFKLTGGGFSPGREGELRLTATLRNPVADAPVAALNAQVSLRATPNAVRGFDGVALTAVVDAEGRGLSEHSQLKLSVGLERWGGGETYTASVDTLQQGATENLLTVQAGVAAGGSAYTGDWILKARTAQLAPFFLGGHLPDFDAHGKGRFSFTPAGGGMALSGRLTTGLGRLEVIEPAWRALGTIRLQALFDIVESNGVARLNRLGVTVAGDAPVLELTATGAAEFNLKDGRLQVGGTAVGELLRLRLPGLPLAWVRPFVRAADVSGGLVTGEIAVIAEKERLVARATVPLRIEALNVVQRGRLLLSKADIALEAETVLTEQQASANVTKLTMTTPAGDTFTARGTVALPLSVHPPVTITANCQADLPALLTPWLPLGHIKVVGETDLTCTAEKIELRGLDAHVTDPAGRTLLKAAALRPFAFDLATQRAAAGGTGAVDLLRVELGRLPLDRLPLIPPGAGLGGVVEQGEFVLAAEGDQLTGRTISPLKLAEVSLTPAGRPALDGLNFALQPAFELGGRATFRAESGEVTVRTATGAPLLTFRGEVVRTPETEVRGSLAFTLEVPALSSQPHFAGAKAVTTGRASGEIRAAKSGAGGQVEARMTLNGLVARDDGQTLPVANLSFRAIVADNGRISVQAPLLLDQAGQRSDLNFELGLTPAGRAFDLEGKLSGEHIELADALALLGVFTTSSGSVAAGGEDSAPADEAVADTTPVWGRFNGRLSLDVHSVTCGTDWSLSGLTGLVTLGPDILALTKLEAAIGEKGRFNAKGGVRFAGGARPYVLAGDFSLTEFDAGKFFRAFDPAKPATVEGVFSVTGRFSGDGETPARTLERTRGSLELTSRQGVFRGLQRTTNKVSMTSKAVELGASVLGSIFGSEKVTKAAEKVAGASYFADQLAQNLGELNYDQLNVRLVRAPSLDLMLEDFSLVAPDIRLLGRGTVTHDADKPLLEQPLSLSLTLASRGKLEQLLGKLRLSDGTRDELGYARTSQPVTIGGTLAKPDPGAYFTRLATSRLGDLLAPEN